MKRKGGFLGAARQNPGQFRSMRDVDFAMDELMLSPEMIALRASLNAKTHEVFAAGCVGGDMMTIPQALDTQAKDFCDFSKSILKDSNSVTCVRR
jgi:hypothetical protein